MDVGSYFGVAACVCITGGWQAAWRHMVKGSAELSRGKVELWGRC